MRAVDMILPPRCIISGEEVEVQGMISPAAWAGLNFISDPVCECCGFPFEFGTEEAGRLCGPCLQDRPVFRSARAALKYDDASRDMILKFKHADQTHAVLAFVPWMGRAGQEILSQADVLVPVPLHRWRFLKRRYNQAALIAYALSRRSGVPCLPDAIERRRATPSQGHLRAGERKKNVRNAFAVPADRQDMVRGRSVVLIDDVYTTGATVNECAKSLLAAGAASVDILTLARVVKPGMAG